MTLNDALDILQKEYPGKYIVVQVAATDSAILKRSIKWQIYVENFPWSDDSPTLDEAIKSLKRKANIEQPTPEDVEVIE